MEFNKSRFYHILISRRTFWYAWQQKQQLGLSIVVFPRRLLRLFTQTIFPWPINAPLFFSMVFGVCLTFFCPDVTKVITAVLCRLLGDILGVGSNHFHLLSCIKFDNGAVSAGFRRSNFLMVFGHKILLILQRYSVWKISSFEVMVLLIYSSLSHKTVHWGHCTSKSGT